MQAGRLLVHLPGHALHLSLLLNSVSDFPLGEGLSTLRACVHAGLRVPEAGIAPRPRRPGCLWCQHWTEWP